MPKIIDRDEYKKELAKRAAGFFSQHGYAGIGMRGIAEHLGVSKSALYHYFPTKEALFLASTEFAMIGVSQINPDPTATEEDQLLALVNSMRRGFGAEMSLVLEYLRGKSSEEIASDEAMQVSLSTYLKTVEGIVGTERAVEALEIVMGKLMLEHLSGGSLGTSSFRF
ncbi:MAG: TetR/AcrR family transcriptional regulator [Rhodobacteraceae bacterium]|nr:TetR/AcrR family transcriptional regulator [Paracoccaceae bacterium]